MSRKQTFIKGAFILTLAGIFTRSIGFVYRIFLSQVFTSEEIGLYQLIFPVYALCYAIFSSGIEKTIARNVSAKIANSHKNDAKTFFLTSLAISLSLSILCMVLLQRYAYEISSYFLQDTRTTDFLIILSYAFPFASIHSCIIGYYFGLKQTTIPACSQLLEQISRVLAIIFLYHYCIRQEITCSIMLAVIGLVIGEFIAAIFSLIYISRDKRRIFHSSTFLSTFTKNSRELLSHATPLTANRVTLNILSSIEAISIPFQLQVYGLSSAAALSTFGVLTGMALPCILFPSAITSSICALLLPTVSEIQAQNNKREIKQVIIKSSQFCILLGLFCLISLFLFSNWIGLTVFHNAQAVLFIRALAWLCPFLYLNTTLLTIINGVGKPILTFILNVCGLCIRIGCIFFLIPHFGINGYLWGLLISQILITFGCFIVLHKLDLV